ncbi:MAG: PEGA domain-containing protein [Myxococcaceae bacterium]
MPDRRSNETEDDQDGGWEPGPGPVLDTNGHVEQRFAGLGAPAPRVSAVPTSVPEPDPELELAHDIRREGPPPSEWESYPAPSGPTRPRRGSGAPLFAIGIVAALAVGGWLYGAELWQSAPEPAILKVYSQPPGARVMVGESELGTTPLMMDNVWPAGRRVDVEIRLGGYKTWRGTFEGGHLQLLEAQLEPADSSRRSR